MSAARRPAVSSPVPGLGPLESAIMIAVWDAGEPLTVRAARDRLDYHGDGDGDDPAYTTVMTVMVILWRKGMLTRAMHAREGTQRAWWYEARVTRGDYLAAVIRGVLDCAPDPAAVLGRVCPADVLARGVPGSATPPGSAPEQPQPGRASVGTGAGRARTRALRLLARERYAEYAGIYEQIRPAAADRYQARNQARMQLRDRYPGRYLELHAQEQARPGTGVPAGIRSKSWQRATARLADLRAPAYRDLFARFRVQGMNRPAAYDRAMAVLREADSDLFTRMLTEEYQLWLTTSPAGTPGSGAPGPRAPGRTGTGLRGAAAGAQAAARERAGLTEREVHVLDALCGLGASREACGGPAAVWEIAAGLSVAQATVRQHLLHLYRKLGIPPGPGRRARLAARAAAAGLAAPAAPLPGSPKWPALGTGASAPGGHRPAGRRDIPAGGPPASAQCRGS